ncbi:MAG TPA: sigma 54-interacting transcriptional regulator [Kofleriaceae bacterium]|nr:sigma 54-interacting transcriptional regulator [Kofleriaceae bacterium]
MAREVGFGAVHNLDGLTERSPANGETPISRLVIAEHSVVVADVEMQRVYRLVERLARSELPLVVRGEPGAGKTTVARAVHAWSARAGAPLLTLDCAAAPNGVPEGLIERELFGCERGAFAAGSSRKPGLLERARGGTLVLDQVHHLSAAVQARLVHALDHRRVLRIGGKHERPIDVRIIAATSEDLAAAVAAGRFRRDLYDRLNAASIALPPLRARRREIAVLAQQFLAAAWSGEGAPVAISAAAQAQLTAHPWPGNVRELEHAMAYAAALVDGDRVEPWHLPEPEAAAMPTVPTAPTEPGELDAPGPIAAAVRPAASFRPIADELQALERRRMTEALRVTGGVQRRAAELIGMPVRTFTFKLTQYGLRDGAVPPPPNSVPSGRIARRRSRHNTSAGGAGA